MTRLALVVLLAVSAAAAWLAPAPWCWAGFAAAALSAAVLITDEWRHT